MGVSLSIIAIFGMILGGLGVTIWGSVKHDRKYDGGYNNNNSTGGYGNYTTNANATGVDFGLSDIAFGGGTQGQGGSYFPQFLHPLLQVIVPLHPRYTTYITMFLITSLQDLIICQKEHGNQAFP